jgi:uncharacterized tellurite resistance protein B-like protein
MALRRFLGIGSDSTATTASNARSAASDTDTVRRIIGQLEQLDADQRRYLAGFAYILARAAHADLEVSAAESALMEGIVTEIGGLSESQAVLVVQIAKHQSELYGGTEDFLVTREFASRATPEQKHKVVEACFAVVASDHTITADEYAELTQIAGELDLTREELNVIRREYRDQLAAIQRMRGIIPG